MPVCTGGTTSAVAGYVGVFAVVLAAALVVFATGFLVVVAAFTAVTFFVATLALATLATAAVLIKGTGVVNMFGCIGVGVVVHAHVALISAHDCPSGASAYSSVCTITMPF